MALTLEKPRATFYRALFGALFLLLFVLAPLAADACGHIRYESRRSKSCQSQGVGYWEIWDIRDCSCGPMCGCEDCSYIAATCKAWQIAVTAYTSGKSGDWGVCQCRKECLESPYESAANPEYYIDPVNKATQESQNIKLPVVLKWNHVAGWKNGGKFAVGGAPTVDYGPQSYIIEIQDMTSESGIANLNFASVDGEETNPNATYAQKKSNKMITDIGSKKAFFKVMDTNVFNSVTDAWPCFFNSSGKYRWRVRPCCDAFGTTCKVFRDDEGWWEFKISTAPEIISPLDSDWNGPAPADNAPDGERKSFKDIREGVDPLRWCSAKLPEELQEKNRPVQYAGSYQLFVTSDESNSIVNSIQNAINDTKTAISNFINWVTGNSNPSQPAAEQKTHALSVVNGQIISDVFANPATGDVETWYPAQSRGDLAYFSRNRVYVWTIKSCPNPNTIDEFEDKEDNVDCYEDSSQAWRIVTKNEKIPAPQPVSPKHDPSGQNPVGIPINISWTIPTGANSFVYETDIGNLTNERKTSWNTIPNKETEATDPNALTLKDAAIKLNTVYHWRVKSCAEFDSTDCDDWSSSSLAAGYTFITTGRPPKTDTMAPNLGTTTTFPQNFTWEHVGGAKSYIVELYDSSNQKVACREVPFNNEQAGQPSVQFGYPDIKQPPEGTANVLYHWRVRTCADEVKDCDIEAPKFCGDLSEYQNFSVYRITAPTLTSEINELGSLRDLNLKWSGRTKDNLIMIKYSGGSTQDGCSTGKSITNFKSSDNTCTIINGCIDPSSKLSCAGTYEYTIYPCIDVNCSDRGEPLSGTFKVTADSGKSATMGNFTVCGQAADNLDTSYDETVDCGIGSFFLVVKLIINFLLFKVAFLMLPIMAMISGGLFYLGMKGKDTIPTIKKIWKYTGIGLAIMFLAWLMVSWLVAATGYQGIAWYQVF